MNKQAIAISPRSQRLVPRAQHQAEFKFGPWLLLPFILATTYLTFSSTDPLLTSACMILLAVLAKLSWRIGEPPILFAALFLQWTQVGLLVVQAAIAGTPLTDYTWA